MSDFTGIKDSIYTTENAASIITICNRVNDFVQEKNYEGASEIASKAITMVSALCWAGEISEGGFRNAMSQGIKGLSIARAIKIVRVIIEDKNPDFVDIIDDLKGILNKLNGTLMMIIEKWSDQLDLAENLLGMLEMDPKSNGNSVEQDGGLVEDKSYERPKVIINEG